MHTRDPFVSLNSWTLPGWIYQGDEPVEEVRGCWAELGRLREVLARYRRPSLDSSPHPEGAAVGYFTYEGDFHFLIFPKLRALPADQPNAWWQARRSRWRPGTAPGAPGVSAPHGSPDFTPDQTRAEYEARVARAQEYIRSGDIYQVNIAQRFTAPFAGDPYRLFEQLTWRSPAPGSAFLDMGTGGDVILSASPELFLTVQGRHVATRPIKGTRPRSRDPIRDAQLAYELLTDRKEIAELTMITDLERNDLGRICEYGSVVVTDIIKLEKYAQVYHLVSTVEGMMRPGIDALRALEVAFPGGSITGAPKKRACEIIAELEPCPRGIFTGAIGYFAFNGDAAFSIAIRTLLLRNGMLSLHAGSGITADSIPAREYEETLHKASGMRLAVESYHQMVAMEQEASAVPSQSAAPAPASFRDSPVLSMYPPGTGTTGSGDSPTPMP
ncbi:aminodeoxychorismate synthase, component I [Verrucomicrobia bacterium LW23]|nr:aminodeoxychorismate synthase, component I [Verrucomicrobia bacterium LW23]